MYKIITGIFLGLLFTGCGVDNSPKTSHRMFQSVDAKDAILVQTVENKKYCTRCGMDLVKFYKTSHSAVIDSKTYQYCSIHCLEEHLGDGITLKNPKVVDIFH